VITTNGTIRYPSYHSSPHSTVSRQRCLFHPTPQSHPPLSTNHTSHPIIYYQREKNPSEAPAHVRRPGGVPRASVICQTMSERCTARAVSEAGAASLRGGAGVHAMKVQSISSPTSCDRRRRERAIVVRTVMLLLWVERTGQTRSKMRRCIHRHSSVSFVATRTMSAV
jgi:hypothetical protein